MLIRWRTKKVFTVLKITFFLNGGINKGLFQKAYNCEGLDLYNPVHNIKCASRMVQKLLDNHEAVLKGEKKG